MGTHWACALSIPGFFFHSDLRKCIMLKRPTPREQSRTWGRRVQCLSRRLHWLHKPLDEEMMSHAICSDAATHSCVRPTLSRSFHNSLSKEQPMKGHGSQRGHTEPATCPWISPLPPNVHKPLLRESLVIVQSCRTPSRHGQRYPCVA